MKTIRPYGDRRDDGRVQLAFTLPVSAGPRAKEAASLVAKAMGFKDILVASMESAGDGFACFVVYGRTDVSVDFDAVEAPAVEHPTHGFDELNALVKEKLGRKIRVVGACIGTDAHTTGIDAIFNMKGYSGDVGLERYGGFSAVNLGAQVEPAELLARAKEMDADAILVSQIVTQRDIHKENARALVELVKEAGLFGRTILVFGGPRVDHRDALDLGFDAGFGPGTRPSEVANYLYWKVLAREGIAE